MAHGPPPERPVQITQRWYEPLDARLLTKPGGFEGPGQLGELVHPSDLAVANRVNVVEARVDLNPAAATPPAHVECHDHAVAHVDELLGSHVVVVPFALPA